MPQIEIPSDSPYPELHKGQIFADMAEAQQRVNEAIVRVYN
jgi:hypothetical protein